MDGMSLQERAKKFQISCDKLREVYIRLQFEVKSVVNSQ
mgnify:CR=1 FL=1